MLDVGCGAGAYEPALQRRAGRAVGLDLSPGMLTRPAGATPSHLVVGDAQRLPARSDAVDVVLSGPGSTTAPSQVAGGRPASERAKLGGPAPAGQPSGTGAAAASLRPGASGRACTTTRCWTARVSAT